MAKDRCDECEFYKRVDDGWGYCRRNPPAVDGFSITSADAWCGEFKRKSDESSLVE